MQDNDQVKSVKKKETYSQSQWPSGQWCNPELELKRCQSLLILMLILKSKEGKEHTANHFDSVFV